MEYLFLDFETYYDRQISLKRMTPPEYIMHPRTETIIVAVRTRHSPSVCLRAHQFKAFCAKQNWANTCLVTFNTLFDGCLLAWRYGCIPALYCDTMNLARTFHGHELASLSLESVAKHLQLGVKGSTIGNVMGMDTVAIDRSGIMPAFMAYANNDNDLSYGIWDMLWPLLPPAERKVMDLVVRAAVIPRFEADLPLLEQYRQTLQDKKQALLERCGLPDAKALMSTPKFKLALESLGIEVQMKPSPRDPTKEVPAFAKTDEFMGDLLAHEDEDVVALVEARLGHRSTMAEGRAERFIKIAEVMGGKMPMPLRYNGAHTLRLSGEWKINPQNLPRD